MNSLSADMAEPRCRHVQRSYVHRGVLSCLLDDIRSGHYQQGQQLPSERELMEEFGVGRPAVREALSSLGRMGLIEISPGIRARVCKPTLAPLLGDLRSTLQIYSSTQNGWRELHDLRLFFETAVARQLADQITDAQLRSLAHILDRQREFLDAGDIRSFSEADIAFHQSLVECLGNDFLSLLARGFGGWLIAPLYASMQVRRQSEHSLAAHRDILSGLAARDAMQAERAMREHLEKMRGLYLADMSAASAGSDESEQEGQTWWPSCPWPRRA